MHWQALIAVLSEAVILAGCAAPAAAPVVQIQTVVVTQLVPASTLTPPPTFTPYPTYTSAPPVIVTATPLPATPTPMDTPTPRFTSTPTRPPTSTPLPTKTPNLTITAVFEEIAMRREARGDGFYMVNVDIAPGIWKSQGDGDDCYWERTTKTGDIIDNHFGMAGGTMFVAAGDFQVQMRDCGTWVYLGQ